MFHLNEFTGIISLANAWTDALHEDHFTSIVKRLENATSKQAAQKDLSRILTFLQSIQISEVALRAERDGKHLERVCYGYYKSKVYPSSYSYTAHRRLTIANFPFENKELCIAVGVAYLSRHFRIWACKRYLKELISQYDYVDFGEQLDYAMDDMLDWINHHFGDPSFAKIYLRAFDSRVLAYYTRRFDGKTVFDYLRDYMKDREQYRLKNMKDRYYL